MPAILADMLQKNEYPAVVLENIQQALDLAKLHLQDKKRLSGDSYYDHVLRVTAILMENHADPITIMAAILKDALAMVSESDVSSLFGKDVLWLAKGVADIKEIKSKNNQLEAEALRKVMFATAKDPRIIVIKLVKKLDNVRTISCLPAEQQQRIAQEVLEFYAPLAYRLGMEKVKVDLENLAFAIVQPQKYQQIQDFLRGSQEERAQQLESAISTIQQAVEGTPLLSLRGRPKHIYSIYRKMSKRGVPLHEQFDLLGVRAIVPEVKDCYTLLGKLHEQFEPVSEKLKDYIANPKANFYRSIHTALKLPQGMIIEVQIRTPEMDESAEDGLAAHWRYKGVKSDELFEKKLSWLRNVMDMQKQQDHEFLETAKVDVFGDFIACYTPKGDVKELPEGASVLDFAYLIHEAVGNTAVGARVNGKFVPLSYQLKNSDIIEVVTNKQQRPRRSWLKIVRSHKTRQKIRKSLKEFENLPALYYRTLKPQVQEDQSIMVESKDLPAARCILAKCCYPLPGHEITGFVTKRRHISVHCKDCKEASFEQKRWLPVSWKETFSQKVRFSVQAAERSGILADLLHTIAGAGFQVKEAKAKMVGTDNVECSFAVVPRSLQEVQAMIGRIQKVRGMKRMYFE